MINAFFLSSQFHATDDAPAQFEAAVPIAYCEILREKGSTNFATKE
jgi:hypothetical protein